MTSAATTTTGGAEGTTGGTAVYVYGVVPADTPAEALDGATGMGERVRVVPAGPVAAVVEAVDPERPLGRRRDLLAHSSVLNALAARVPVLPVRFGSVLASEAAVVDELLAPHQEHFVSLLEHVAGTVQYTLRARYVMDDVLADVVRSNPEVARLRERTAGLPEEATHFERVRLGELVAHEVDVRRQRDAAHVLDTLAPHAEQVVRKDAPGMDGLLEASFLVAESRRADLERAAEAVAEEWDGRARVSLLGPMALFDFVAEG